VLPPPLLASVLIFPRGYMTTSIIEVFFILILLGWFFLLLGHFSRFPHFLPIPQVINSMRRSSRSSRLSRVYSSNSPFLFLSFCLVALLRSDTLKPPVAPETLCVSLSHLFPSHEYRTLYKEVRPPRNIRNPPHVPHLPCSILLQSYHINISVVVLFIFVPFPRPSHSPSSNLLIRSPFIFGTRSPTLFFPLPSSKVI